MSLYIDQEYLQQLGDSDTSARANALVLLDMFQRSFEERQLKLERYLEMKNHERIAFYAHSLKSSSLAIGFVQLSRIYSDIEKAAVAKDDILLRNVASDVHDVHRRSITAFSRFIGQLK